MGEYMGSPGFATPEYLCLRNGRLEGVPCSVLPGSCQRRPAGEETVQKADSRRCPQGFQRQLFCFDQVQGVCQPGDLVPCTLLWPIKNAANSSLAGWLRRLLTVGLLLT